MDFSQQSFLLGIIFVGLCPVFDQLVTDHSVFCPGAAGLQFSASPLECFPESFHGPAAVFLQKLLC